MTAILLCIAIFVSQINIVDAAEMGLTETVQQTDLQSSVESDIESEESQVSDDAAENEETDSSSTDSSESVIEEETQDTSEDNTTYYQDGKICIYNYSQLQQIGSGNPVHTGDKDGEIGSGETVTNEDGELVYSPDGQYLLMNDIVLDISQVWTVSDSFTGKISGETVPEGETPNLYDKETDTIYIYNPYQLMVLAQDDSENEPVMSLDYDAPQFGMGQMIYPDGEDADYLTYSKNHHYVISVQFDSDKPELVADQIRTTSDGDAIDGRDFQGQVVKTIGDETYILIGNAEQLRKIGSGDTVYGAVYQAYLHNAKWYVDTDSDGNPIMLYGGDADLTKEQNGTDEYSFGEKGIHSADKKLSQHTSIITERGRCGVTQSTGEINPNLDIDKASGQKYSASANYIIFRDIDLSDENWTPLMFSGNMIGAKASGQSTLWNNDESVTDYSKATDISDNVERPVISNITVDQSSRLEVTSYIGVGFFATISSVVSTENIGLSGGTTQVSDLELSNVKVSNTTTEVHADQTLISGLLSGVGGLLGGLVDILVGVITIGQVQLNLRELLSNMLNARAKDPTALATGCFAGRVVGDVKISHCKVSQASVTSVNDRTGGFIGYMEGMTEYDGLSKLLKGVVDGLTKILNIIPGLGLGDLITILLGNAIPVGDLIPTGYINAVVEGCEVSGLSGTVGTSDKSYIGGFIGQQTGSWIKNSGVENSSYTVTAQKFGGGFVGLARDGEIKGTLTDGLNIDIKHFGLPASLLYECSVKSSNYSVTGCSYLGGFAGAQAYTDAINCTIDTGDNPLTITGTDIDENNKSSCVGGFCGNATIGWLTNLGSTETTDTSLLKVVTSLLTNLLSANGTNIALLSLVGVAPSAVAGCQIHSSGLNVSTTGDYAGGLVGKGDAAYIGNSSDENLQKLVFWQKGILTDIPNQKQSSISNLKNVTADNYAGGVAGSIGTASVAGLLNATVGLAAFLGFTVDDVSVSGITDGSNVKANSNCAGGAFGEAIGGTIENVSTLNLNSVTANNIAGGFIGITGTGSLASTGGLTINLLGLNHLLKVSNLLSVAQGVEVEINDSEAAGISDGYTVKETGSQTDNSVIEYSASGFAARAHSAKFTNCKAENLKSVTAADHGGSAGGFVGISKTGGLAEVSDSNETAVKTLIEANGLLTAVQYLIPSYTQCTVVYVDGGGVSADTAGGFAGDFQSGTVDNQNAGDDNYYAVYNLDYVNGQSYAGGFGGNVYSGALAQAAGGISILGNINGLNINITQLLDLINAYIPYVKYAGIKSDGGFTVSAKAIRDDDSNSGSAGGFIGYGSGVQVSYCNVSNLKNTTVTPPKDLESTDGSDYFDEKQSTYAVTGARYAGGYIGYMDIGSAASVGKGLSVLGKSIAITDVLDALNVVVSTIEHSDVTGNTGGFAVKASM